MSCIWWPLRHLLRQSSKFWCAVHRYDWCITSVTNILASYHKNGIAFVIHPNRGQIAERKGQPCRFSTYQYWVETAWLHTTSINISWQFSQWFSTRYFLPRRKTKVKDETDDDDMNQETETPRCLSRRMKMQRPMMNLKRQVWWTRKMPTSGTWLCMG